MIRNYYRNQSLDDVVVLDFDLSWHKGSREKSFALGNTVTGYLAPEQTDGNAASERRSALVDSFGLGMTLYFVCTGKEPVMRAESRGEWSETLKREVRQALPFPQWVSLPARVARLIDVATRSKQAERWDVSQICDELSRLCGAAERVQQPVMAADLLAEELLCRSDYGDNYEWSASGLCGSVTLNSGVNLKCRAEMGEAEVRFEACWNDFGAANKKNIHKFARDKADECKRLLCGAGWTCSEPVDSPGRFEFNFAVSARQLSASLPTFVRSLNQLKEKLSF
jgi:hypothetical protein